MPPRTEFGQDKCRFDCSHERLVFGPQATVAAMVTTVRSLVGADVKGCHAIACFRSAMKSAVCCAIALHRLQVRNLLASSSSP